MFALVASLFLFQRDNGAGLITKLLKGHRGKVHCVKWLNRNTKRTKTAELELISGASDSNIIVWKIQDGSVSVQYLVKCRTVH